MNNDDEHIEIILPASLHGEDELDALSIFQHAFAFSKKAVGLSKSRTLLKSADHRFNSQSKYFPVLSLKMLKPALW